MHGDAAAVVLGASKGSRPGNARPEAAAIDLPPFNSTTSRKRTWGVTTSPNPEPGLVRESSYHGWGWKEFSDEEATRCIADRGPLRQAHVDLGKCCAKFFPTRPITAADLATPTECVRRRVVRWAAVEFSEEEAVLHRTVFAGLAPVDFHRLLRAEGRCPAATRNGLLA